MPKKALKNILFLASCFSSSLIANAASVQIDFGETSSEGLSAQLKLLIFLTFLTFLPAIVLTVTSFTRTVIIFSMLRTGLGTQSVPPNQVMIGLTLFLTFFIMAPVVTEIKTEAVEPYMDGVIGEELLWERAKEPLQDFMIQHTRANDLELFAELANLTSVDSVQDIPFHVLVPAFIISELKTAFEMGFLILIPFIIVDFAVSSMLMSMGMFMLPPTTISLPIKIIVFILVDGWHLVVETVARSFIG